MNRFFPVLFRVYFPGIVLAAVLFLGMVARFVPLTDASDRLNRLPAFGPGFVSEEMAVTPKERAVFGDARVLRRRLICQTGDAATPLASLIVTVIDGTRDRHAVHDPVYCFQGAGWQVVGSEPVGNDRRGPMRLVHLRRKEERRDVVYFFSDGRARYSSPLRCWSATTLRRITFGHSGDEPLLIVVEPDFVRGASGAAGTNLRPLVPMLGNALSTL